MLYSIIFLVVLIFINGILSASELAFLSLEKYDVEQKKKNKKNKKILKIIKNPSSFLSTIQVGITLAGFLSSAFAASTFANYIIDKGFFLISEDFTSSFLILIITIILSYFTLVFGELVPKKIALANPYKVASLTVSLVNLMQILFYPLVALLTASTDVICKILNINEKEDAMTEEDIKRIIITGTNEGIIEKKEQEYIFNIFKFNDIEVENIMTPIEDCTLISADISFSSLISIIRKSKFSRYPVYDKDKNNIIGIFNVKNFILYNKSNTDFNIKKVLFPIKIFKYNTKIDDVFASMQKEHVPMALVKKEGKFIGIVTLEDAIEEVMGNIYNEYGKEEL